jgi:uncharacterized protein (TIGR02246 family)
MRFTIGLATLLGVAFLGAARADDKDKTAADEKAIRQCSENWVKAFNSGNVADLVGCFAENAELVDENGTAYTGRAEIKELFTQFFQKFPGSRIDIKIEGIHFVGPNLAVEDCVHVVKSKEDASEVRHRYVCVWSRQGKDWQLCSAREYADEGSLTPHDRLQPLAWMIGDWVDEDSDSVVAMSYRWSKDKNYILCDYNVQLKGKKVLDATQRIGWDPLTRQVRSWVFDSDGGYGQGAWTRDGNRWIVKSTGVLPDGSTGSATFTITPQGKDRFVWKSTDRIAGDAVEADFEVVIARKAQPAK